MFSLGLSKDRGVFHKVKMRILLIRERKISWSNEQMQARIKSSIFSTNKHKSSRLTIFLGDGIWRRTLPCLGELLEGE